MLFKLVLITSVLSVAGGTYQDAFYKKREAMRWLGNIWSKILAEDLTQLLRKQRLSRGNKLFQAVFENKKKHFGPGGFV